MRKYMKFMTGAREQAGYLLLLAVMLSGSVFLLWANRVLSTKVAVANEDVRPAEVELTLLTVSDCADCFDVSAIVKAVSEGPMKILRKKEVSYESEEGKALVERYGIDTVPTVVIQGEIKKRNAWEFLKERTDNKGDALVWAVTPPVFMDTTTGKYLGRVKVTIIGDTTCGECYDAGRIEDIIRKNYGVHVSESRAVDRYSSDGARLVKTYGIKALPTIILSPEAVEYARLVQVWPQVGTIEDDGFFVFRRLETMGGIYRDLKTGKIIKPLKDK